MKVFIKEYSSHLYAHIYEHIVGTRLDEFMSNNKLLSVLDIYLDFHTDFNIIGVKVIGKKKYERLFTKIVSPEISESEIISSLNEISLEYRKNYKILDIKKLCDTMNKINRLEWREVDKLKPVKIVKKSDFLQEKYVKFFPHSKKQAISIEIQYTLPKKLNKLAPLAAYIFSVISENQVMNLYLKTNCYFPYKDWNSWGDYVSCIDEIVFDKKDFIGLGEVKKVFFDYMSVMINELGFIEKMQKYLIKTPTYHKSLFPLDVAEYSGYWVGEKGWKKLATKENIQTVLDNMKVDITVKKD